MSLTITDRVLANMPFAEDVRYKVHDTEVKGLMVIIGKRTKTFYAEGFYWKNGKRQFSAKKTIGDASDVSIREARGLAKEFIGAVSRGINPKEKEKPVEKSITLRDAWARYRTAHLERKLRSKGTIANYTDHVERLMVDWLDVPLEELGKGPRRVAERHDLISDNNGTAIANGCMRSLRAIYNHALRSHPDLPGANPTRAVDWNPQRRRNTAMGTLDLGGWFEELFALENPIRREFHLFTLLSGSRPSALKVVTLKDIDFKQRLLHIPKPKGGEDRAFDIPLSRQMVRCLIRAIRYGRVVYPEQSQKWIFPSDSVAGHLSEQKEDRTVLSKWGNDLRQTYRTIGQIAGISKLDIHLLMNHAIPGVNEGYITRDKLLNDLLKSQQQNLSGQIISSIPKTSADILRWVGGSKKPELKQGWVVTQGFRIYTSDDPYHTIRKARRLATKAGQPMSSGGRKSLAR